MPTAPQTPTSPSWSSKQHDMPSPNSHSMAAATLDFNSKLKLTNETPYTFLTSHVKPDRLLVVLDLDKTLIHSELHDVGTKDDCSFVITNSELREMGFDPVSGLRGAVLVIVELGGAVGRLL
jgi:hypothetical protein